MAEKRKFRLGRFVTLILCLMLSLFLLFAVINAKVVRIHRETVTVSRLNPRLYGYRILFLSDLKISSEREARQSAALVRRLVALDPDLIILGGDITGKNLIQTLRERFSPGAEAENTTQLTKARDTFLAGIYGIGVPCFAVYGEEDIKLEQASASFSDVMFLDNAYYPVNVNGAYVLLAGTSDYSSRTSVKNLFPERSADLTVFICHDPTTILREVSQLRRVDLALAGHTLGGQVTAGGLHLVHGDVIRDNEYGKALDLNYLISDGIGTEFLPLRVGTRPTAYLLEIISQ